MEQELTKLKLALENVLTQFSGPLKEELEKSLHSYGPTKLPNKDLAVLAAETVDHLHSVEQLLTPAPSIIADHFLGMTAKIEHYRGYC